MWRRREWLFSGSNALRVALAILACVPWCAATAHQAPSGTSGGEVSSAMAPMLSNLQPVNIMVGVRDARGLPIEELATVRITSNVRRVFRNLDTKESADVSFANLLEGPYDVTVECPGYRTAQEHLDVTGGAAFFRAYIYLHAVTDPSTSNEAPKGMALAPKAVGEIDKGLAAMRKKDFESAQKHFTKASTISPGNSDVYYLRGSAELRMEQSEPARKDFEKAVALEPDHEKALLVLGEMQLKGGDSGAAIQTLNRTVTAKGAGWRTYYLLSAAYANLQQWKEADRAAQRAVALAGSQAAAPMLLMGDIRLAGGDQATARDLWQKIVGNYPTSPQVADAKAKLAALSSGNAASTGTSKLTVAAAVDEVDESRPWAPPDIDSKEYYVTPEASCDLDDVLSRGMRRMKTQLVNLEKFTALEHIEHQEIDRHGLAGPIKTRQFSYIVFVHPFQKDSVYLEEDRGGGGAAIVNFPTSLATVGLNSLGLSVLQPAYRPGFVYKCEGVATVRGQAAWQVRFEEKKDSQLGVRRWQREGTIYNIPVRGRIWLSTTTFDIVRVETELLEPVMNLELTRDHLEVEYGPVNFNAGMQLWLPWSAEMYLELHGKRYHHKHYLTDYLLFGVDTSTKIALPKVPEPPPGEEAKPDAAKPPQQ